MGELNIYILLIVQDEKQNLEDTVIKFCLWSILTISNVGCLTYVMLL